MDTSLADWHMRSGKTDVRRGLTWGLRRKRKKGEAFRRCALALQNTAQREK
jgi:hypothetical protein